MVHTLTIYQKITLQEFKNLKSIGVGKVSIKGQLKFYKWKITTGLKNDGITSMCVMRKKFGFIVSCIINLNKIISNNRLEIFIPSPDNYELLIYNFNAFMAKYKDKFDILSLENWSIGRIDYCVNLKMADSEEVLRYIKLMQRGDIPRYSEDSAITYKTSCYLKVGKYSKTVNFYSKYDEMLASNNNYSFEELEEAKKFLRLEVQEKDRIKALIAKYELPSRILKYLLRSDISRDEILSMYSAIFHCGRLSTDEQIEKAKRINFYTLNKAKSIVNRSTLRSNTKQKLCIVLEAASRCRSLYKAITELKAEYPNINIPHALNQLSELNISPVTVLADWGITCMPSLINSIISAYKSYEVVQL